MYNIRLFWFGARIVLLIPQRKWEFSVNNKKIPNELEFFGRDPKTPHNINK